MRVFAQRCLIEGSSDPPRHLRRGAMSYIDQENGSRRVAIGGVVLLHIVVGYALISGFAINVITHIAPPTWVRDIPDDKPPPRRDDPPPPPKVRALPDRPVIDKPIDL